MNFFDNFYKVSVPQGSIVTDKMIEKLEVGLTEAQVKYIMGSPTLNDGLNPDVWVYIGTLTVGSSTEYNNCLLYTSPSPRDVEESRMPSSA